MSFRMKMIAGFVVIQTLLLIAIIWSAQFLMQRSHETELRQRAATAAELFATTTKDAVLSMDLASLSSFVDEVLKNPDFSYARVLDAMGRVLAAAGPSILLERPFREDLNIRGLDDGVFDTSAKIKEAGIVYGKVEIGISAGSIVDALEDSRRIIALVAVAEIAISILLSTLLGSYLARRLDLLKKASECIAAGEVGYQIDICGNDEIAVAAKAFNQMSLHLKESLAEIYAQNVSLEAEVVARREAEEQLQKAHEKLEKRVAERTAELAGANDKLKKEIDERHAAESKRRELELRLQRIEKMEALGTLAGGVAHDLNNVLSGIVTYPDLLLHKISPDDSMRKPVESIRNSGLRAAAIVQDLLTLARRGVVASEVLNLNHMVDGYMGSPEFEKLADGHPGVRWEKKLQEGLLNVDGSPAHLMKTVANLATNAVEAMPSGGCVEIRTENRYVDKPFGGYDSIVEGDYAVLSVADQGAGVSPEDREKIFEPFYTKKFMGRSGTGLGMAVVWGTVKDHGGYIDVQSDPERGSVFHLYFPVTRKALTAGFSRIPPETYRGKGETVLIVDDVAEQRQIASDLLSELGYEVGTVPSGEAAVAYLSTNQVDLIVLDMIMEPGMDGLDTYRAVIEVHPGQKAVIASGYSETDRVREAQRLGAGEYVKKPYTMENIGMAVRSALDSV